MSPCLEQRSRVAAGVRHAVVGDGGCGELGVGHHVDGDLQRRAGTDGSSINDLRAVDLEYLDDDRRSVGESAGEDRELAPTGCFIAARNGGIEDEALPRRHPGLGGADRVRVDRRVDEQDLACSPDGCEFVDHGIKVRGGGDTRADDVGLLGDLLGGASCGRAALDSGVDCSGVQVMGEHGGTAPRQAFAHGRSHHAEADVTVDRHRALPGAGRASALVSRYSSKPATPISRPMPDCR